MIVAPILAIMSYFATDYLVSEKPHIAKDGSIYTMRIKSNCRWDSGKCTIDNEDITLHIVGKKTNNLLFLNVSSNVLLSSIKVAFNKENKPQEMSATKGDHLKWNISLPLPLPLSNKNEILNFAIVINKSIFLAQVSTIFIERHTTYK